MNKWEIEEEVLRAARESESIAEMLRALGMKVNNGNYRRLKAIALKFGAQMPTGGQAKAGLRTAAFCNKLPDDKFFAVDTHRNGPNIKKRLIQDQGYEDKCAICGHPPFWNGKPLTLQVDHINGDRLDNRLENLRILCPHCHSQTDTFANNGSRQHSYKYCPCGVRIGKRSEHCPSCASKNKAAHLPKVMWYDWPPVDECVDFVKQLGYAKAAKKIGVSDNGLRKYLSRNGIDIKQLRKVRS